MEKIDNLKQNLENRSDLTFIAKLHRQFKEATVYLVGGAVRDFLLKKEVTDLDFLVTGLKKDKLESFLADQGSIKDVKSRTFGVFIFRPKDSDNNYDVALPRSDKWTGKGYRDLEVDIGVPLKKDLKRRDFTVNSMAVDLRSYQLIDHYDGQKDLKKGLIKAVGEPADRFREDPSRILRGIRFANQLDFKIEKETKKAMKEKNGQIVATLDDGRKRVSEEVVGAEFLKSFDADSLKTIKLYDQIGVLKLILPEIANMKGVKQPEVYHSEGDVYRHTLIVLKELEKIKSDPDKLRVKKLKKVGMFDEDFSIELKLGLLLHDIGKPATFTPPSEEKNRISFNEHDDVGAEMVGKIIKRLKLTQFPKDDRLYADKRQVKWLVKKHMILVVAKPKEMRLSTLEKYFFHPSGRGKKLMTLSYCDISATVPKSGKPDYELLNKFLDQIENVEERIEKKQEKEKLPPPLLDGKEIMEILSLQSGPVIGKIKDKVRDLELSGKLKDKQEAKKWLEKNKDEFI